MWTLHQTIVSILAEKLEGEKAKLQDRLDELNRKPGRPLTEASRPRPYSIRNPERPSETWAEGKQPHWVSELLEAGRTWTNFGSREYSRPAPNQALSFDDNYLAERRARPDAGWIRKSSSFLPDLSWAVSQRGCLPLPAQVSAGWAGFLYFGNTCGYGRRAWFSFLAMPDALSFLALPDALRPSCRKRRSSCDFSSVILRANAWVTSS